MDMRLFGAVLLVMFTSIAAAAAPAITKETISSGGRERTYYLFVPSTAGVTAPLVVLLHGSGRDGKVLLQHWNRLAEKEGIILAGPEAIDRSVWQFPADGPVFLRDVVRAVQQKAPVDPRRVYLFGHSAGASFAIPMALLQSRFYAAAAAHAGSIDGNEAAADLAVRKVPVALIVGVKDASLSKARRTKTMLEEVGHVAELTEMPRHGHDYYGRSREINDMAWRFLSAHALDRDPVYIPYANVPE